MLTVQLLKCIKTVKCCSVSRTIERISVEVERMRKCAEDSDNGVTEEKTSSFCTLSVTLVSYFVCKTQQTLLNRCTFCSCVNPYIK